MSTYQMTLEGEPLTDAQIEGTTPGYWIAENVIHERAERRVARIKLPKGSARVVLTRIGGGRAQLALGGLTTTSAVITGPTKTLEKLREALL